MVPSVILLAQSRATPCTPLTKWVRVSSYSVRQHSGPAMAELDGGSDGGVHQEGQGVPFENLETSKAEINISKNEL